MKKSFTFLMVAALTAVTTVASAQEFWSGTKNTTSNISRTGDISVRDITATGGDLRLGATLIQSSGSDDQDLRFFPEDDVVFDLTSSPNPGFIITDNGSTTFFVETDDDVVGINTFQPLGTLDVRGDNLILTRPGVSGFNLASNRFTALGESGGTQGAINGCDIYGFRSQLSTSNFINVGVTSFSAPTISWETTRFGDRLDLRVDNSTTSCGTLVAQFGTGTYELIVYGNVLASGGSFITSDGRLKRNVAAIESPLDKVRKMEGTTYEYKTDEFAERSLPEGLKHGFIAQDLRNVLPEAVIEDEEGYLAVNYDAVIPVLVEAVKELDKQMQTNRDLQLQLTELKAEVEALREGGSSDENAGFGRAKLFQNTPNPFNVETTIAYELPASTGNAELYIYDMQGKQVAYFNNLKAGAEGVRIEGSRLEAGMYLYTLIADGKEVDTRRMILTR
ncbi:tail fiber domain-containing protein [Roseivirga sp. BDSF3-8]|uniref:tail fiber domain-containing protein n=1 Tax=Roseivirga sp. BDSF3-8 TaxID=3241598 RepID=UPI003531FACA